MKDLIEATVISIEQFKQFDQTQEIRLIVLANIGKPRGFDVAKTENLSGYLEAAYWSVVGTEWIFPGTIKNLGVFRIRVSPHAH